MTLLELFDREMRRIPSFDDPRFRWETDGPVVRLVGPSALSRENAVIYSHDAAGAIDAQVEHFRKLGHDFEWKVYGHDVPADLGDRLTARGFVREQPEALLILDLETDDAAFPCPDGCTIERVTGEAGIAEAVRLQEDVWKRPLGWFRDTLRATMSAGDSLALFLARCGGRPASSAHVQFTKTGRFATLGGAGTHPDFRGRGIYRALVAARVSEARRRGVRYLVAEAWPDSRPILERLGFRFQTMLAAYTWRRPVRETP